MIVLVIGVAFLIIRNKLSEKNNKEDSPTIGVSAVEELEVPAPSNAAADDEELVAVITAAVIACLGGNSSIVVKNIRRVDDLTPVWGKVSRTEQMAGRF